MKARNTERSVSTGSCSQDGNCLRGCQRSAQKWRATLPSHYYIAINVSGRRFKIEESLLNKYPDTLLGSERRYLYYDKKREELFFDRDPDIFPYVLKFYRSGKVHCPENECAELFENELKFFGILNTESPSLCCGENFELSKFKIDEYRRRKCEKKEMIAAGSKRLEDYHSLQEKLWFVFEQPGLSIPGFTLWVVTTLFILVTVISIVMETIPKDGKTWGEIHPTGFFVSNSICVVYFTLEYIVKLYSSPDRWQFVKRFSNIIDLLSILPYYVGLASGNNNNGQFFVILRVLRVTRVFKISRFSAEKMQEHSNMIKQNKGELGPLMLCFVTVLIIFSAVIYYMELVDNPSSKFPSIPAGFWYTIVTMTSLGYGDLVPETIPGKIIGALCSLSGIFLIALMAPLLQKN